MIVLIKSFQTFLKTFEIASIKKRNFEHDINTCQNSVFPFLIKDRESDPDL